MYRRGEKEKQGKGVSFSLFFFFGRREMATDFEVERSVARRHLVMELIF